MEDSRGTKRPLSPSKEGSPSPSSASTPPSASSGSPRPPGSPSEVSSRHHCSPVFEQGEPSERVLVVDLTSNDEDNAFSDTSQDEEFTRRLFGDLNNGHLGLPSDGKVIILNDSDEEEEVREETATDTEAAPSSAVRSPAPTASTTDADEDPKGMQDDNSDGLAPYQKIDDNSNSRDEAGSP
jgi:hypothetical protein